MNAKDSSSRWLPTGFILALLMVSASAVCARNADDALAPSEPAPDSYWVVSLAWSPEFCHNAPEFREEPQCAESHGFVLNSLEAWSDAGPVRPCSKPEAGVPAELLNWMMDTMFNRRWIRHQWSSRGGCAGLAPDEYFVQAQYLGSRVAIPDRFRQPFGVLSTDADQVRDAFIASNATLAAGSVRVRCERGWLSEVRFCVNRDFSYRDCLAALAATSGTCSSEVKVRGIDPRLRLAQID